MAEHSKFHPIRIIGVNTVDKLEEFVSSDTLRENLERIIPKLKLLGILGENVSTDDVEVHYNGKPLNLDLPFSEQNVKADAVLELLDLSSRVRMAIRYEADRGTRKLFSKHARGPLVLESVAVNPTVPLKEALKDSVDKLRSKRRFYGRKLWKYNLIHNKVKLDKNRSLRDQGIGHDVEVFLRPRILFEWPPGLLWPPKPYTTYLLSIIFFVVVGIVVYYWTRRVEDFYVILRCKQECKILKKGEVSLASEFADTLHVGKHDFTIFPKDYPIFDTTITLVPERSCDKPKVYELDLNDKFPTSGLVEVSIAGYYCDDSVGDILECISASDRLDSNVTLFINHFPRTINNIWYFSGKLPPGRYEIKHQLNNKLKGVIFNKQPINERNFIFDLNESLLKKGAILNLIYTKPD